MRTMKGEFDDLPQRSTQTNMSNRLTLTAPERIWLQCGDEPEYTNESFNEQEEVTWCSDSVVAAEVEYVRADLVRAAMPVNWMDEPETRALGEALHMTANYYSTSK